MPAKQPVLKSPSRSAQQKSITVSLSVVNSLENHQVPCPEGPPPPYQAPLAWNLQVWRRPRLAKSLSSCESSRGAQWQTVWPPVWCRLNRVTMAPSWWTSVHLGFHPRETFRTTEACGSGPCPHPHARRQKVPLPATLWAPRVTLRILLFLPGATSRDPERLLASADTQTRKCSVPVQISQK